MSQFAELDFSSGETHECTTPTNEEITLVVAYLNRYGDEHFLTIRSTDWSDRPNSRPEKIRAALDAAFEQIDGQILSVQMTEESSIPILGREKPRLYLV